MDSPRDLIEELPFALWRLSTTGQLLYANPPGRALLTTLLGHAPAAGEVIGPCLSLVQHVQQTGGPSEQDHVVEDRVYHCVFHRSGDGNAVNVYSRDVTERRRVEDDVRQQTETLNLRIAERTVELEAERAQLAQRVAERTADLSAANAELARAARAKDEFLASISHELRTPLNTILGMAEALQEGVFGVLSAEQLESIRNVEESGRHLLEMINDLLDLSKMEAGKMELQLNSVKVEALCAASQRLVGPAVQAKRQRLVTFIDPAVAEVVVDNRRVRQMLLNLLTNASKFTPEGGQLGLEVMGDADEETVRFTVWDSGIGIAPEDANRLFKPFSQLDTRLSRQYPGTGLGLMLVYRMAELHGGSITLESQPERGSRLTIALPWRGPASGVATARAALPGLQELTHVLLIQDSPGGSQQISGILNEVGVRVSTHLRAEAALPRVIESQPQVILLDAMLPDGSGWDVLAQLLAEPRTAAIPVIILSGIDEQVRAREAGAAACLLKPVMRDALRRLLGNLMLEGRLADTEGGVEVMPLPAVDAPLALVADDTEPVLSSLARHLQHAGFRIAVARNGTEVIERAREELPAVMVLDQQMPGPDGMEVVQQVRADSRLGSVPIVALSALVKSGDRERCLEAGANDYWSKPISGARLVRVVQAQLENRRKTEAL